VIYEGYAAHGKLAAARQMAFHRQARVLPTQSCKAGRSDFLDTRCRFSHTPVEKQRMNTGSSYHGNALFKHACICTLRNPSERGQDELPASIFCRELEEHEGI